MIICKYCNTSFHIKPSRLNQTFCSKKCRLEYNEKNYTSLLLNRFLSKVRKETVVTSDYVSTPCWIWKGNVDKYGYGYLTVMKPTKHKQSAHRTSMMLHFPSTAIEGRHVCHSCHNKLCVNPAHLHEGTPADNIGEMVEAERQAKGIGLPQAKLTEDQVRHILSSLSNGVPRQQLANGAGVSLGTIDHIAAGKAWKHISRGHE